MTDTAIPVVVGSRQRFENWCRETFDLQGHDVLASGKAILICSAKDVGRLYGRERRLRVVSCTSDPRLLEYAMCEVARVNAGVRA